MIEVGLGAATETKAGSVCRGNTERLVGKSWGGESPHSHNAAEFALRLPRHGGGVSGLLASPPSASLYTPTLTTYSINGHKGMNEGKGIFPGI